VHRIGADAARSLGREQQQQWADMLAAGVVYGLNGCTYRAHIAVQRLGVFAPKLRKCLFHRPLYISFIDHVLGSILMPGKSR
jgi:hypothetical protein